MGSTAEALRTQSSLTATAEALRTQSSLTTTAGSHFPLRKANHLLQCPHHIHPHSNHHQAQTQVGGDGEHCGGIHAMTHQFERLGAEGREGAETAAKAYGNEESQVSVSVIFVCKVSHEQTKQ